MVFIRKASCRECKALWPRVLDIITSRLRSPGLGWIWTSNDDPGGRAYAGVDQGGWCRHRPPMAKMVIERGAGIAASQLGLRLKAGRACPAWCAIRRDPALGSGERSAGRPGRVPRVGLRSMIVVPLRHEGETVGVLKAMSRQPGQVPRCGRCGRCVCCRRRWAASGISGGEVQTSSGLVRCHHKAAAMTGLTSRAFYDRGGCAQWPELRNRRDKRPASVLMIGTWTAG